eukprot:jgi/Astpho2/4207/fgenesh1_pm.00064_%23_10_t
MLRRGSRSLSVALWGLKAQSTAKSNAARAFSNQPEDTVYGGPSPAVAKRITLKTLRSMYAKGEPISMVTAYDYPSAVHVDMAGIDILLVGDSVGMVVHGHDTTLPVTLEDILVHCKAVFRGTRRPFLVADLPFGSYEVSAEQAVRSAVRLLKEANMDASTSPCSWCKVTLGVAGGGPVRTASVKAVVDAGVAVMGHIGLTPQSISVLGGFGPQGKTAAAALRAVRDAKALEEAGCFALVLECLPNTVSAAVTSELSIPTIGIGAGGACSGQVLVYHDLLGMMQHPHYRKVTPKFAKQFASLGTVIHDALSQYKADVASAAFPGEKFSPYNISDAEVETLLRELEKQGLNHAAQAVALGRDAKLRGQQGDS